ncbi:MAG: metal-dependent hydrolase [candidate division Zixibacteria bacterium]|nr:metal-dependent hydrolase [candidate division Zixibacteria bacterium]
MDNLTHTLFGAAVGRLFEDKLPRKAAFWTAAVSSNLPDADFIYRLEGAAKYFDLHRGFSHSIGGLPLEALAVAGIVWLFVRQKFKWIFLLALLASFCHTLLDLLNPYPTCALLPFTDKKFAWDLVFIVDPFLWLVFSACLIWGRRPLGKWKTSGMAALFIFAAYVFLRLGAHELAAKKLLARPPVALHETVKDYGVYPRLLGFWQWRYVVETDSNFYQGEVSFFEDRPYPPVKYAKAPENEFVAAAKETYLASVFLKFARFPYLSLYHRGESTLVRWDGLRYVAPGEENFFGAAILVSPSKQAVEMQAPPVLIKRTWRRIVGRWGE